MLESFGLITYTRSNMAINKTRYINTKFWNDNYVSELDPIQKLLFIYFLTNEHTNISGVYEVPLKVVALETGIDKTMVEKMIPFLAPKVGYVGGLVVIKNFLKHQETKSDNTVKGIVNCWDAVGLDVIKNLVDKGLYDIRVGGLEGAIRGLIGSSKYLYLYLDLDSNSITPTLDTKVVGSSKKKEDTKIQESWEKEDKIKWRNDTLSKGMYGEVIIDYFIIKEMKFPTKFAANQAFKREMKIAREIVEAYPDIQLIKKALNYSKKNMKPEMWTLETINKKILPTL